MKTITLFILIFCGFNAFAQKMPDYGLYNIRINDTAKAIHTQVIPVSPLPKPKPNLDYYWFSGNTIHQQQGGFSGKLLNGIYEEYYTDKSLKTQGTFTAGLKDGLWKSWNENDRLSEEVNWDKGRLSGKFTVYNINGKEIKSGIYKNGVLDGKLVFNAGTDSARTVLYKNGTIVPPKEKQFFKRINIFKNKTAKTDSTANKQ